MDTNYRGLIDALNDAELRGDTYVDWPGQVNRSEARQLRADGYAVLNDDSGLHVTWQAQNRDVKTRRLAPSTKAPRLP